MLSKCWHNTQQNNIAIKAFLAYHALILKLTQEKKIKKAKLNNNIKIQDAKT